MQEQNLLIMEAKHSFHTCNHAVDTGLQRQQRPLNAHWSQADLVCIHQLTSVYEPHRE